MKKIRFGILSTAKIGTARVIPAMQQSAQTEITAIASRNLEQAQAAAKNLNIPKSYGSYESLLADKEIDAVYIPLPNHLHVDWAMKSLEAGKHVLFEKPFGLNTKDAERLLSVAQKFPQLKAMEAFMYRFHPQWNIIKEIINSGEIGEVKYIHSAFMYHNVNPADVRNQANIGGGGLLDIGCYCISFSRFIFGNEPKKVFGEIERDAQFQTDKFASAILEFENGKATCACSTQLHPHQFAKIVGTQGHIDIEFPFTPPQERPTHITVRSDNSNNSEKIISFEPVNQYTLQGNSFALSILNDTPVPTPLSDGIANMKVIDKIFESAGKKSWINL